MELDYKRFAMLTPTILGAFSSAQRIPPPPAAAVALAVEAMPMEYRPRPSSYGQNWYANGEGYGGGYGNGNGAYAGDYWDGGYHGGGGDGRYLPYGRGAVPAAYGGVGDGMYQPALGAAMPSTSHGGYAQGWGWSGADQQYYPHGAWWAYPPMIHPEAMWAAEAAAGDVLLRLHPTEAAERRRHQVIDYARRLIGTTYGCEVYAFGSVPLRTYLPDGDIDITIATSIPVEDDFIEDVYCLFTSEEDNDDAQFVVKEVKIVKAKVQLIKCIIDNIVVDISFNQIGGVSTFCFLEMVDSEIGKQHLFKKSIILIKAWCYHEGNIHGSNQWLISTYALEVLILYIFNVFHESLDGPLEALYKFLEYYSKFDWENYCVTINGPMLMPPRSNSTIERVVVNDDFLLSKESFKGSLDRLIVLPIGSHRHDTIILRKPINIIDPLKGDNNLGNSISSVNSKRIMEAFKCGAGKLGKILKLPSELIVDEIYGFFATTLGRHGRGERQDLGGSFSFQSMLDSGNGHGEDVSSLENSYGDKDENKSPDISLELADKESDVKTNMHQRLGLTNFRSHSSSSSKNGNTYTESGSHHILTSSTRANSLDVSGSYPIIESNLTDVHQEKLQLPPFSPSDLLDLSGDLGLYLKCFRSVQYNLEAWCDKFLYSVREASLAGVLDEDCFEIPTLRFLSDTNARSTDTDGKNMSLVNFPQGAGDVTQPSIKKIQNGGSSSCPSVDANSEAYNHLTNRSGMYMLDMNFSLPPRTDTLSKGWSFYPENYPISLPYMPGDIRKTHGTGTYIPKTDKEICKDKKEKLKQLDQVDAEEKPDQVNSCNGHASIESPTGEPLTTETVENREQRNENGSRETPPLPTPRTALPHHGGQGQGNLLVPSTGRPSLPAVTMVNSPSITAQQHENLEFGTMGPFSDTLLTAKFMEDFPPLASTKKPLQAAPTKSRKPRANAAKSCHVETTCSTVESPSAGVSVTQSKPVEAPASPVQSPRPGESVSKCRPEGSYLLRDDADFPPLRAVSR